MNVVGYFNRLAGDNKVENVAQIYRVRLYREKIKDPFAQLFLRSQKKPKFWTPKLYSENDIKALRTLGQLQEDKGATAELAALPDITKCRLSRAIWICFFIRTRCCAKPRVPELEAYLLKTLAPHHFEEGRWPL